MKKRIASFEKITCIPSVEEFYNDIKLPERSTKSSAGYDFYLPYDLTISPNETVKILTGVRAKMKDNYVLMIFPRSSLGIKYKLTLDNTVAIIDADYYNALNEGHIMLSMTNHSSEVINLKKGDRFVQGIFVEYGITYDDNADGKRTGGFGSTNK